MTIEEYQGIKFVSGPFAGLIGKALNKASENSWYVQVFISNIPVVREVKSEEIESLR